MQRAMTAYTGELTFNETALELMRDAKEVKRAFKNLTVWLRKKAKKEGWSYDLHLCLSQSKPYSDRQVHARLHGHFLLVGKPGTTIAQAIRDYWASRYGYVKLEKLVTDGDIRGKQAYMDSQAEFTWEQQIGIESLDGGLSRALQDMDDDDSRRLSLRFLIVPSSRQET